MLKRVPMTAWLAVALLTAVPIGVRAQDPSPDQPLLAGTDVPAPKRHKLILPEYPEDARAQGVRGIVLVEIVVERDGKVGEATLLRSIPLLDTAALTAVKQWEYDVTKVDDKPVRVRLTVPITFSLKIPDVTRQDGIPELRSGATPVLAPNEKAKGHATVSADVTLDAEGRVAEAVVTKGDSPWSEALLRALRTWVFATDHGSAILSFKLVANFVRDDDAPPRVDFQLSGPRRSESVEPTTLPPSSVPASAPRAASNDEPATTVAPPSPAASAAPPVEVISAPPPPTPPADAAAGPAGGPGAAPVAPPPPPRPTVPGISSVRDVVLGPGVPDLTVGRRPVVPPNARLGQLTGAITVEFNVSTAGTTLVSKTDGSEAFKTAAEQMVASWQFRRTSTERLFLTAKVDYGADAARALVTLVQ